jgi:sugar (pentulose or hexulose) kinase
VKKRPKIGNDELVLGLDSSTTGTKTIAVDTVGRIVASASAPIPLYSPKPNHFEQNSADWWRSACAALREVTQRVRPERIVALAISNQRETFVPLGSSGKPLRRAIIWLDERSKEEVGPFSQKVGSDKIHRVTGKPPDFAPVLYRLAWMKRHEPALFRKIRMICDVHTYLAWRLTGLFRTSWASADPLGLFDLQKKKWSPIILKALGLGDETLPETFQPGSVVGIVGGDASKMTGLDVGTLVVAGGGDGQAAGLGSNALTPERAYLNLGTAVVAGIYGETYKVSKAFRTMSSCSDRGYYYECSLRAGTFAVDWFIQSVLNIDAKKQPGIYTKLEREARRIPAGSGGVFHLPYLCGVMNPYWDMEARGAFIGLSSWHNRGHLYRSILEGIAFEQRLAIEAAESSVGRTVRELVVIGGGASNSLWCRIIADITGKILCIPSNSEASALGAGITAAVGAGWYGSFRQAASRMSGTEKKLYPDRANQRVYTKLFEKYVKLHPLLSKAIG